MLVRSTRPFAILILSLLALAGCGGDGTPDGGTDAASDVATLPPIDCPGTCAQTLPYFCTQTVTAACASNCALEVDAVERIGTACQAAYEAWFGCILTTFETNPEGACAEAVGWYETHALSSEDSPCHVALHGFADACELEAP